MDSLCVMNEARQGSIRQHSRLPYRTVIDWSVKDAKYDIKDIIQYMKDVYSVVMLYDKRSNSYSDRMSPQARASTSPYDTARIHTACDSRRATINPDKLSPHNHDNPQCNVCSVCAHCS